MSTDGDVEETSCVVERTSSVEVVVGTGLRVEAGLRVETEVESMDSPSAYKGCVPPCDP